MSTTYSNIMITSSSNTRSNKINKNSSLNEIKKGFKINWMNMGDAESSQISYGIAIIVQIFMIPQQK